MIRPAWVGRTLFIGAGIVAFANVVALGGVAYNRVGAPDSELRLSERELDRVWTEKENNGLSLTLRVQYVQDSQADSGATPLNHYSRPYWLNDAKLKEMGFPVPASLPRDTLRGWSRSLRREALFVLEFDGPTYHRLLDRSRDTARIWDSASAAHPKDAAATGAALRARTTLEHLERGESRLFVVDAGRDAAALRARYPDRGHYAIVWGRYSGWIDEVGKAPRLMGEIRDLDPLEINVPHRFRGAIGASQNPGDLASFRPMTVTVAFGKRREPWIVSVEKP